MENEDMNLTHNNSPEDDKVILYHGTSAVNAMKIAKEGFNPKLGIKIDNEGTHCLWFTTDIISALVYSTGGLVVVEAYKKRLEELNCHVGIGSRGDFEDVFCCEWDKDKIYSLHALMITGKNFLGEDKPLKNLNGIKEVCEDIYGK
jgi:hypothetical protein